MLLNNDLLYNKYVVPYIMTQLTYIDPGLQHSTFEYLLLQTFLILKLRVHWNYYE